jgi:hypothetical protein
MNAYFITQTFPEELGNFAFPFRSQSWQTFLEGIFRILFTEGLLDSTLGFFWAEELPFQDSEAIRQELFTVPEPGEILDSFYGFNLHLLGTGQA